MKWYEVCAKVEKHQVEDVSMTMIELGSQGIQHKDPEEIKEMMEQLSSGDYVDQQEIQMANQDNVVIGYYSIDENITDVIGSLYQKTGVKALFDIVDDASWKDKWKEYFKPFYVTSTIQIIPSWSEKAKNIGPLDLLMDPGMAFGTGTHETTKLCAHLLESVLEKEDDVLDVGTGTGILAMIASKKGAKNVLAIDIDTAAIKAAKENMDKNHVYNVRVQKAELDQVKDFKADVICANIIADVIIDLSKQWRKYLKQGGKVICSGIINARKDEVCQALKAQGFEISSIKTENEWTAILAYA